MKTLTLAILLIAVTATALSGQSGEVSWENLKQLKAGHKIKLEDMDLKVWDGRLVKVSDEAITIREKQKQQEITVERAKVFRVRDLQRSRRGRNALIGLLIGGVIGGTIGAAKASDVSAPMGGLIMFGMFGGPGAAIGASIPSNHILYSAKDVPQKAQREQER